MSLRVANNYVSRKGLNNYSHPRTDPVVIMAIVDESGENVLLGRNVCFCKNILVIVFLIIFFSEKIP